ncbi:tRNA lysidine(34) synthetase [Lacunimicrobium album]
MSQPRRSPDEQLSPLAQILGQKLENQDCVLLAVSGGADSIALLRTAVELRQEKQIHLEVAHFQHHLRGQASLDDQSFVEQLCKTLSIPCHVGEADWTQEKPSEASARHQRYAFLVATANQLQIPLVLTAHHASDQAETVLHHIIRGTGIAGLAGMTDSRMLSDGVVLLRPFLSVSKQELLSYLTQLEQPFREDESNASLDWTRNRLRHDLLPLLTSQYNEQAETALLRLAQQAREVDDYLKSTALNLLQSALLESSPEHARLDATAFAGHPALIRREAFVLLWTTLGWPRQKMGFDEWQRLSNVVEIKRTSFDLPGPIHVERRASLLVLTRRMSD